VTPSRRDDDGDGNQGFQSRGTGTVGQGFDDQDDDNNKQQGTGTVGEDFS
jgi:hypothetical protein